MTAFDPKRSRQLGVILGCVQGNCYADATGIYASARRLRAPVLTIGFVGHALAASRGAILQH